MMKRSSFKHTKLYFQISCFLLAFFWSALSFGQFPTIAQGDVVPGDDRLTKAIGESKDGELTIASFNIRNLGRDSRSYNDYEALAGMVDEADVVVIQEAGLGIFSDESIPEDENRKKEVMLSLLQIAFGQEWEVIAAATATGVGSGRETCIVAYRKEGLGYKVKASWYKYVDLGDKRDMAVFKLNITGKSDKEILIGSVHLTPDDPDRGEQMIKAVDWLKEQKEKRAVIMGDFNWGYVTSGQKDYKGETYVNKLHEDEEVFHVFKEISYNGKGKSNNLRTNMNWVGSGMFYDQFITSPLLAKEMADGGKLLDDCGIHAFDFKNSRFKKVYQDDAKYRMKSIDLYYKNESIEKNEMYDQVNEKMVKDAKARSTFFISDHRPIWVQFSLY
jgi:endonuclease/exonuclease/phosphatase family metal-dependent hydrolase